MIVNQDVIKLTINGIEVKDEATYSVELSDLDDEGYRNITNGKLVRNRIRNRIYKISLAFSIATIDRASQILTAIDDETFTVSLYDIYTKTTVNKPMYVGNRTYGYVVVQDGDFKFVTEALTFNLIEV